jgi:hypothetical protein
MRWARHVARIERRGVYWVLGNKRQRPLERLGRRREDNIKMDIQEVGC